MTGLYILGLFAAGQGLFQTFLIGTGIKGQSKDQILLGSILFFLSISVLEYALVWSGNIAIAPHLIGFSSIAQFLFLPLIYFFFLANNEEKAKLVPVHFLIFGFVLFQFRDFLFLSGIEKIHNIGIAYTSDLAIGVMEFPLCILFILQSLAYLFLTKKIKNWTKGIFGVALYRIMVCYILIHIFHTTLIYFFPLSLKYLGGGILTVSIVSIYALSYYAYKRAQVISEETLPKYFSSTLEKTEALAIIEKLNAYMKRENTFTNCDIRMISVAEELGVSSKYLSQSINQELGCTFREYLNGLRVEYAKTLIGQNNRKSSKISLKEIAFDSGFNNKTSFANAFKKKDNMTPSQYLKLLTSSSN